MRKSTDQMLRQLYHSPRNPEMDKINSRFAALNEYVTVRRGWITGVPGAVDVTIEVLPGSTLPDELRKAGYDVCQIEDGQRILPAAITERFARRADGELEPVTEGSTRPIAETRTHAGIVKVKRWAFSMP
jgi:hypothetical protein